MRPASLRVVGDEEVGCRRAADTLLPPGAHEGVAGALRLADFDGSERHGSDRAGAG